MIYNLKEKLFMPFLLVHDIILQLKLFIERKNKNI